MKRHEVPDVNTWNLHQLARAVSRNANDTQHAWSAIQEAYAWTERFEAYVDQTILKRCVKDSLQVAIIAATEMSLDLPTAIAALLTPPFLAGLIEAAAIEKRFGLKTASILKELKALKSYRLRSDTIRNYPNHPDINCDHILAILLQICDIIRVHCSGITLENLDSALIHSSAHLLLALKYFYIPLSHRMRMYDIQTKLADFWLKHTDTLSYYAITAKLGMTKIKRQQKLNLIAEEVQTALQARGIHFIIKKRIKSVYSIWHKIQKLKVNFDQIHDLTAIRIILTHMDGKTLQEEKVACWRMLSIISNLYKPMCNIMRDWISTPRDSSYESLHLTFETYKYGQLEVQIRTERMDYIAEHGEASHWRYKYTL
ncbi:bifunctional (p)ppGpp synthetase/guanosine-3',5'-bis(diphosphate) 3'-pyrophosphohydrolase [Cardinium endosymbiont of Sogatella furcifera]|uniref:bifunctional (p)ppGpp synthetase/guanosine-3',5'-bis(diphosphate) 3'-pyrophosphohydrolase n=1 Tax=Cardinium endosymbiont of Sogatella furcifera TaxID=650378 RepID=UPI000E0CDB3F|nr:bifunctional (p)ppGpp synthetase/guanosine-3',5'-bis(diphosphate) 3'-pyrophosphohydrolase [Cardinium endosymbiont of Sogatella furcifera]